MSVGPSNVHWLFFHINQPCPIMAFKYEYWLSVRKHSRAPCLSSEVLSKSCRGTPYAVFERLTTTQWHLGEKLQGDAAS